MATETQKNIAKLLDEGAAQATAQGYPETAKSLEQKASDYRASTGQAASGGQQGNGQANG